MPGARCPFLSPSSATVQILRSSFSQNFAPGQGGAIFFDEGSSYFLDGRSVVQGHVALAVAGGVRAAAGNGGGIQALLTGNSAAQAPNFSEGLL